MATRLPTPVLRTLTLAAAAALLPLPGCKPPQAEPPAAAMPQAEAPAEPKVLSWRVASAYLEDIFATIPNSSIDDMRKDMPEAERQLVNASHGEAGAKDSNAYVYGEPSPMATSTIMERLSLQDSDVIYDLGCGRGFFLMQALLTTPIKKAVGVELAASRLNLGKQARALMLDQGLLPKGKTLDLFEQDMTTANLDDATIVYMDSVFFSDELLLKVAQHMAQAKNMRKVVMIMKGLPPNPWFERESTERMKMSWSPKFGTDVLFYKRTAAPAP